MSSSVTERLSRLRTLMREHDLAAWLTVTADPHLSEYVPERWKFVEYLSGFTGSFGELVVTPDKALLWTDSRYWEQAERQLAGSDIELMRYGRQGVPGPEQWLAQAAGPDMRVACDDLTITEERWQRLSYALCRKDADLIESITTEGEDHSGSAPFYTALWPERPDEDVKPLFVFTNGQKPVAEKVRAVRDMLRQEGADALFLSSLEDIAWLTNLRGHDIACTPVFTAYLTVTDTAVTLWVNQDKLTDKAVLEHLSENGIAAASYEDWSEGVACSLKGKTVLADPAHTSHAAYGLLEAYAADGILESVVSGASPVTLLKSRKSREELELLKEAMRQDGAALVEFFALLDEKLAAGEKPTELELSELLHAERAKRPGFIEDSFEAIVAFGENAALPHYNPKTGKNSAVDPDQNTLLLIDSGAHYLTGTTDITRTVIVGRETDAMETDYTAVLRAHIALADALFPKGVYGSQLDTFARAPLWEIGADFGHGTGHGVGFVLSVHEGPVSISPRSPAKESSRVVPGLVLSNEPGLYRAGRWGIRTENLVTPVADETMLTAMQPMQRFETLSLAPFDTHLIKTAMMTPTEINWVNDYHARVKAELMPLLSPRAQRWLEKAAEII